MAEIRPFCALRFATSAGNLADLVAPPYDVISADDREVLASRNDHNMVHLTLPESHPDDRSKFVKYMRSASRLADWRRNGALVLDDEPSFYRYRQTFQVPDTNRTLTRTALITLIKVEPYEKGVVLPHEQTFPKHKEDRLRVLEATRSHLECIYGLFEDEGKQVLGVIDGAPSTDSVSVKTEDGLNHTLDRISDPALIAKLQGELAAKKVWIADGHHRYETALAFRQMQGEHANPIAEDYMMMALSSISDPGLVLLPTHRIVHKMPIKGAAFEQALQRFFNIREVPNSDLLEELSHNELEDNRVFGIALPGGMGYLATLDRPSDALKWTDGPGSHHLKLLEVSILHDVIFDKVLELRGLDFFSYTRDANEALAAVENGSDAAFLMNPPTVDDMRLIALGGEKMPQKSTYYYPKILSGLAIWSLGDFS